MFERFTNRARHVVVLAQEEARLLDHNYIGTEHILLGLLGEPESIGGKVLATFGITRDGAREEVTAKVGRGKKAPSGHIPFTPRAKKTLELSLREALAIKHNYIGTEHILLGLIREGEGVAVQIMGEHADVLAIRAAVFDAVSAPGSLSGESVEAEEAAEETNAVLRWLRQRLTLRHAASVPFRPELRSTVERPSHGTPAVEAALEQAARLAGPLPVGSHHLLLAALDDQNSAASWALASLGVDLDELRSKLRSARLAGTTDEQPEQAGRRQMAINVSDEILTVVLTDPVIVEAGKEALRTLNARTAPAVAGQAEPVEAVAGQAEPPEAVAGQAEPAQSLAEGSPAQEPGAASVTATVIRGDHPAAAGLANVWLELRKTLATLADTTPPSAHPARHFRQPRPGPAGATTEETTEETTPGNPEEESA
jgi:Clp amino terminal domain, pathogenicity island component